MVEAQDANLLSEEDFSGMQLSAARMFTREIKEEIDLLLTGRTELNFMALEKLKTIIQDLEDTIE